ncbi:hypothetical protein RRG08_037203 [Elysia crispata]|uniref:Uncharacterized protein n=1 Tax=Elysia crispata TaxID=231223 RepID=A0AAE1D9B7_9GAST|nr:hypothetical protein RRG08_037203 [Elysia crispata]
MLSSPGAVGGVPRLLCFTDARSADERPVSELTTAAINNAAPSMSFCSGQLNRFVSLREGRGRRSEGRPVRREILGRRCLCEQTSYAMFLARSIASAPHTIIES